MSMAEILPYRSPRASERATAYVGMVIFVAAWAMMFACLFFAYGALRLGVKDWPPLGQPSLPLGLPALNTAVIVASSAALELGLYWTRRGQSKRLSPAIAISALLGAAFLVVQWIVGADLFAAGLTPDAGPYASVFYGLAGIHGLHVAVGLIALLFLAIRAAAGVYNTPHHLPVRLWSIYWHFVGFIWLLMFVFVFLI